MALPRAFLAVALALGVAGAAPPVRPPAAAHWTTRTANPAAQAAFDRGLLMLYAFDAGEARVAFAQAAALDPEFALAMWGEALADAFDINIPTTAEGEKRGLAATERARRHLRNATEQEKALVDALARRFGGEPHEGMRRYADALSAYARTHRDDPNVLTVTAYAIWNAEDDLEKDGQPTAKAHELLADLDAALVLDPENLGAHHLRLHALEHLARSREAIPDAEALDRREYPLGTSHLPHMGGHIWARLGEYEKLIDDNTRAAANDRAWFAAGDGAGQHYMRNYEDHVLEFIAYGLTTLGRDAEAAAAVKGAAASVRADVAMRTRHWPEAATLAPAGPGHAYALAKLGRTAEAQRERESFAATIREPQRAHNVVLALLDGALAHDAAAAAVAYARGWKAEGVGRLGDPKNGWAVPIGELYGAALLRAQKPAEAEHVFRIELGRFPNDPRLEFGLAEALRAQSKDDAAPRAAATAHWQGDRPLTRDEVG